MRSVLHGLTAIFAALTVAALAAQQAKRSASPAGSAGPATGFKTSTVRLTASAKATAVRRSLMRRRKSDTTKGIETTSRSPWANSHHGRVRLQADQKSRAIRAVGPAKAGHHRVSPRPARLRVLSHSGSVVRRPKPVAISAFHRLRLLYRLLGLSREVGKQFVAPMKQLAPRSTTMR